MSADPMRITRFRDVLAAAKQEHTLTWPQIVERLTSPGAYERKADAPLLKLGTFGTQRTDKGALRHDANMLAISGIEGDYDAGIVTPMEAIDMLERHRIRACVYTSPSHTDDRPRWRVLAPLAREHPPQARDALLRRLNGALGGILTAESFTLSQTFYYGRVNGHPYQCLATFGDPEDGICIDERDALDEIAIGPPRASSTQTGEIANDEDLRNAILSGENYHEALRSLSARFAGRGMSEADIVATLTGLMDASTAPRDTRWKSRLRELPRMARSAIAKYQRDARPAHGAEDASDPGADWTADVPPHEGATARTAAPERPAPADILRSVTAPAFDYDDVPEPLASLARAWCEATGFDRSGIIVAGVIAAAAAIDDRYRLAVRPASQWYESARLWGVLIGGPSAGKSPTLGIVAEPIRQLHGELYRDWLQRCEACAEDEDRPPRPALFTSDATVEALSDILRDNPRGVLMLTEEFGSFIGSIDAYKNGQGKDRGEWLQLYDGGPHQIDRVKRGSFLVPNWSASVLAAGTPAGLRKFASELPEDGLIHRFIPCVMATPGAYGSASARDAASAWAARVREMFTRSTCDATRAHARFAFDAQQIFDAEVAELRELVSALADAAPALAAHLGKHAGMLARVALVFHWLDARPSDAIEADTVRRAVGFMRRVRRHANALYSGILGAAPAYDLARSIARAIVADTERPATIGRYYMTQRCRAFRVAQPHERRAAIELLEDAGWLIAFADSRVYGGMPSAWAVDERVYDQFAAEGEAHRARRAAVKEAFAS